MKMIRIEENQSLRDIALAHYGTMEAVGELLLLNGDLCNDKTALAAAGIDHLADNAYYVDVALEVGSTIKVDEQSKLVRQNVIKELFTPQTKYTINGTHY